MKAGDLIKELQAFDPEMEVMILDGFNGGGSPRTINLGPSLQTISQQDAKETADCEGRVGESVVRLGYGCY
ncbi:MAG: hypothetical protein KJZ90_00930 [Rhodocyclaceae bacterium]|nr:hypothetical protein [Rhodocyclaceae bacterium]